MIVYRDDLSEIVALQLTGFFEGWPDPPSPETHLRILQGSDHVVLALDSASDRVVGFVTAISDGVLSAYIPLVEVLPGYRGQGIGTELMRRMLARLESLYMVDLMCDPELEAFYRRFGMRPAVGMVLRNRRSPIGRVSEIGYSRRLASIPVALGSSRVLATAERASCAAGPPRSSPLFDPRVLWRPMARHHPHQVISTWSGDAL